MELEEQGLKKQGLTTLETEQNWIYDLPNHQRQQQNPIPFTVCSIELKTESS